MFYGTDLGGKDRKAYLIKQRLVPCGFCRYHRKENAPKRLPKPDKYKNISRESVRVPVNNRQIGEDCPICEIGTLKMRIGDKVFTYKGSTITIPNYITHCCSHCGDSIVDNATLRESGMVLKEFMQQIDN